MSWIRIPLVVCVLCTVSAVRAEMKEISVAQQYGIGYLPLMVIEDQKQLEKSGFHTVVNSYEVLNGPATFNLVWTTSKFQDILAMLNDPSIIFTTAPQNVMKYVNFMHKIGSIEVRPDSWKDMFFPNAHNLRGS